VGRRNSIVMGQTKTEDHSDPLIHSATSIRYQPQFIEIGFAPPRNFSPMTKIVFSQLQIELYFVQPHSSIPSTLSLLRSEFQSSSNNAASFLHVFRDWDDFDAGYGCRVFMVQAQWQKVRPAWRNWVCTRAERQSQFKAVKPISEIDQVC